MKIVFSVFFAFISFVALNQALLLSGPDYNQANPLNCNGIIPPPSSGTNFSDGAGNYAPNMNEVLVLCPDLTQGSKVSIAFATNSGFEFNIDPSDTLFIYDGPTTSSPLLGAYNSGTNPFGFWLQASFANNPSGCLTLKFVSNGTNEGSGWVANVACGNPPQPFFPHIEAFKNGVGPNILNLLDTGYVDLCFGDSLLLVATPTFPYALEATGTGYTQTLANCTYLWTIGGSGQSTGSSVWFTPPARSGYYVDLKITDAFPQIVNTSCKVRVSQLPIFAGIGTLEDSVCLGQNTNLIGGVTAQDTVGVNVPGGEFQIGGIFAGFSFLPDGAGQLYETSIGISGFDQSTLITSAANFDQLCLDIEHSYIGDLEITLTCPNGTTVSIINTYNGTPAWGALVPGGCGNNNTGTFLGNDTNIDGGAPGSPVWSYCFSPTNATLGTICAENTAGNTITNDYNYTAMDTNGVYLPDGNFNDFIGCPVNGNWTISVQDNQGIDDGYIFQWGIYFNAALYPESEGYQNTIVSDFWTADPSIISSQNDTLIIIQPAVTGNTFYTYNVTDNFGCAYDTTVALYVMSLPSIFSDTVACNYVYQVTGTTAFNGGVWSSTDPNVLFSNPQSNNPQISTNYAGIYPVSFTDEACNQTLTANIEFPPLIYTQVLDSNICAGSSFELTPLILNTAIDSLHSDWTLQSNYTPTTNWFWENGSTEIPRIISVAGSYIFSLYNACYTINDTATIGISPSSTNTTTATACGTYTWNGQTYSSSGVFTGTTANCVTESLNLTITPSSTNTTTAIACNFIDWYGTTYTASGVYSGTTANCVTESLNLTIIPSSTNTTTATACGTYTWNGTNYTSSGTYTGTTANCVTQALNLTINPNTSSSISQTALDSYTWPVNNQTYTTSGAYTAVIPNAAGCDSTITLNLTMSFSGINDLSASKLCIYPNPTNGDFTITGLELVGTVSSLTLTDMNGKVVKVLDTKATKFSMASIKPGVYFLNIISGNKQEVLKIVKE